MERYEAYKDSGVEWIGEIPESWAVDKAVRLFATIGSGTTPKTDNEAYYDGTIPWAQSGDLGRWRVNSTSKTVTEKAIRDVSALTVYRAPYIAIAMYGASIGSMSIVEISSCVNQACCVLSGCNGSMSYYAYALDSAKRYLIDQGMGGTQPNISQQVIRGLWLPRPSLKEQQAIADYLDARTAEVDALVADCEREVGLLQEYRKAVISEAVTKGLDPDAPMKDSGVEWIGEIPKGWEPNTISGVTKMITNGYVGPTRDLFVDEGVRYLQSLHIVNGALDFEKHPYYVADEWSMAHSRSVLNEGDVLVVQTGAIGNCAYVDESYAGCNCHALIVLRPDETQVYGRYLYYYLTSDIGKEKMLLTRTGATHPHLNATKIKFTHVVVPPLDEQRKLIAHLDDKTAEVDSLIEAKQQMADKLREYRRSLISEAVTGKFKVPEVN